MAEKLEPVCIIHFEGKEGDLTKLGQGSLTQIIERRKQWLNLDLQSSTYAAFTEVAKKSELQKGSNLPPCKKIFKACKPSSKSLKLGFPDRSSE